LHALTSLLFPLSSFYSPPANTTNTTNTSATIIAVSVLGGCVVASMCAYAVYAWTRAVQRKQLDAANPLIQEQYDTTTYAPLAGEKRGMI